MKIIKFEKDNCPSCTSVERYLSQYENLEIERINPFDFPERACTYKIIGVPVTILVDEHDKEVERTIGFKPDELESLLLIFQQRMCLQ